MTDQAPPPPPVEHPPPRRRTILWVGLSVLIPVASAVVLGGFVLQASGWTGYHQGSGSMLPTLSVSDYFLVDHDAYGDGHRPQRGDIIVFTAPAHVPGGRGVQYIKRVVGLPGDSVAMKGGTPIINGKAADWQRLGAQKDDAGREAVRWRDRLADDASYEIPERPAPR